MEDKNNIDTLCNIFELNSNQKNNIKKSLEKLKENISQTNYFFIFIFEKILSIFKIDLMKFDYQLKQEKLFKINKIYNKFLK